MRIVNGLDCIPILGDGHHSSFVEIYVPIYPFCFDSHGPDMDVAKWRLQESGCVYDHNMSE